MMRIVSYSFMTGVGLPDCMISSKIRRSSETCCGSPGERERSGEHLSSKGHAGTGANGSRPKTAGEGYGGFMAGYGGFMEGRLFEEIWMTTFPTPGVAKRKLSDPTIKIQGLHSMDTTHLHVVGIPPLNHPSAAQTPNQPLLGGAFSGS